ncbi:MAG: hypothetical protein F6K22_17635 [Okeania sp. SIO2F4]|uniref:hypothetical protein n=1 Tax=Okeania sp. SIO2F4 TaxID=2607790 RepID=UPI0014294049|nr:hypothetical protein [Okeania sp. SIO2F4]NES04487.1 hypothetical protein [Okeania sp. SIO2F4]
MGKHQATHLVLKFKHDMESRDLAPATSDRRIEALRSLVKFASDIGRCDLTALFALDEPHCHNQNFVGTPLCNVPTVVYRAGKRLSIINN